MQMDGNCIDIDMCIYIYTHANAHGLQTSHHQDLRQFEQLNRNMPSRHSPLMSHQKSSLFGNIS